MDTERRAKAAVEAIRTSVLAAWRRDLDALRVEFDARLAALQPAFGESEVANPIERLAEELCGAAAREIEEAAARARSEAEQAAEERLETAQAIARSDLDQAGAEQAALRSRIDALDAAHVHAQQALAASEARIASEARERTAVAAALEAAHRAATAARAKADASQAENTSLRQTIETLHDQMRAAAAAQAEVQAAHAQEQQRAAHRADAAPLARLHRSLQAFAGLSDVPDVVAAFVKELERSFDRVALFVVRENRLEGWQSIGFEPTIDISNLVIPFTVDSPLTRAASERRSIRVAGGGDDPTPGLLGHETSSAIAIPIAIEQGLVAVAYAELGRRLEDESRLLELQMAEILAEHLMQSLTHIGRSSVTSAVVPNAHGCGNGEGAAAATDRPAAAVSPSYPGPARAAARVRMPDMVEVAVDGATAQLIDLSNLGAQVTCVKTIRPNQQVRLVLPQAGQNTLCSGQVMWALFEMAPEGGRYRAGLKFTAIDSGAIEAFLSQQLAGQQRTSA